MSPLRTKNLIAIDAHKASFTFAVFDNAELTVGPSRRPNNEKNVRALVRQFPNRVVIVEACGVHEWMCDTWIDEGAAVFVGKPFKADSREKSDNRDTVRLAWRYLSGELKQVHHFPPELRMLRSIVRERSFLVGRRVQVVNHIRHELNRWNLSHLDIDKDADELVSRLPHLSSNLAVRKLLDEHVKPLDKLVREKGRQIQIVQHLTTIGGFGDVVGLAFYAEIGDIKRFATPESLVKYLGLDPVWKQSGDTLVDAHHISKAGRPLLRGLLLQAAWAHVNFTPDSPFTQKYREQVKAGKPKGVAIMATTRRLTEVAWRLWHDERDFTLIRPAPVESSPTPH